MKIEIYGPSPCMIGKYFREYHMEITVTWYNGEYEESIELTEYEIIELAGITAQLSARIQQRRADEKVRENADCKNHD